MSFYIRFAPASNQTLDRRIRFCGQDLSRQSSLKNLVGNCTSDLCGKGRAPVDPSRVDLNEIGP